MAFSDSGLLSVLLVEDNPGDARLVEHYLGELGARPSDAPSLTHVEGLSELSDLGADTTFDVALLDLGLPESTGIDTVDRYLSTEPPHPVVVLTGYDNTEMAVTAISHGAQDYLPKDDLDADRLSRTIRYAIERHHQERELKRQNARLEEFASVVSHDLRNPLNVALGRLELHSAECETDHGPIIERNLRRMQAIIDDVLTLARQGADISEPTDVDLASVVKAAWSCVDTDGVTLYAEDALQSVPADPSRLQQLFENLFRNSVEHGTRDDRSTLTVRVGMLDGERGFYVADDGPGIPPAKREHVFDAGFTTADSGTGFGLSIVNRIAEAHGWTASVPTDHGEGARFEFTFQQSLGTTQDPTTMNT